jgi:hypothetical protein
MWIIEMSVVLSLFVVACVYAEFFQRPGVQVNRKVELHSNYTIAQAASPSTRRHSRPI